MNPVVKLDRHPIPKRELEDPFVKLPPYGVPSTPRKMSYKSSRMSQYYYREISGEDVQALVHQHAA